MMKKTKSKSKTNKAKVSPGRINEIASKIIARLPLTPRETKIMQGNKRLTNTYRHVEELKVLEAKTAELEAQRAIVLAEREVKKDAWEDLNDKADYTIEKMKSLSLIDYDYIVEQVAELADHYDLDQFHIMRDHLIDLLALLTNPEVTKQLKEPMATGKDLLKLIEFLKSMQEYSATATIFHFGILNHQGERMERTVGFAHNFIKSHLATRAALGVG